MAISVTKLLVAKLVTAVPESALSKNRHAAEPPPKQLGLMFYNFGRKIGRKYRPIHRFLANAPVANCLKTNYRLLCFFHGMEEVVGSIPTRSTNFLAEVLALPRLLKSLLRLLPVLVVLAFVVCATAQSIPEKTSHELIHEATKLGKRKLRKLESQSNAGDVRSQLLLATAHQYGFATKPDQQIAAHWISRAAQAGEPIAQTMLGRLYVNGAGVVENQQEAITWFRRAADQGNAEGQFELAVAYDRGSGVPLDKAQAISLYQMAADSGFAPAKCALSANKGTYQSVREEPKMPRTVYAPDPEYSEAARRLKLSRTVALWVGVRENGTVGEFCVRRPAGFGLDERAVDAVRRWRFEPYERNGRRIPFGVNVETTFKLY
ncbi:MAG: TonB family protein [Acidobacteriales bacterium]|nr:TonB family protein [Terriglobales bacterium]